MNALMRLFIVLLNAYLISCLHVNKIGKNDPPPPHDKIAKMARYIVHHTDWVSLATISTQKSILGYPFVSLKSFCDGPEENSTGIPYFYMTSMDVSAIDIIKNNSVSIMATLAEVEYCADKSYDPQDPRCPKVIISGKFVKVDDSTPEHAFAKDALFERHPAMRTWPSGHGFYVCKVEIEQICVLDYFGGIKYVAPQDYFDANYTRIINIDSYMRMVSVEYINGDM